MHENTPTATEPRTPATASVMPGKAMVSIAEAADFLSVSVPTVRRMIQRGELPARKLSPQVIRVRVSDLDALGEPAANIGEFL